MVNFSITADTTQVDDMLKRFGTNAVKELTNAVNKAGVYGMRELHATTPKLTNTTAKQWKWQIQNKMIGDIINDSNVGGKYSLIEILDTGHGVIKPKKPNGILIFQLTRRKGVAKTASKTGRELLDIRQAYMKTLKGKKLTPQQKNEKAVAKTGIVIAKSVKATTGKHFIKPAVEKIQDKLNKEVMSAFSRLLA